MPMRKIASIVLAGVAALLFAGATVLWFLPREPALPQAVRGPLSGYQYDCQQAGQRLEVKAFVSSADLDGDGKPDYIFDVAKGCEANRLLYCNAAEGCNVHIFLSSRAIGRDTIKARSFNIGTKDGKPALLLELGKVAACKGAETCRRAWVWRGEEFALTE